MNQSAQRVADILGLLGDGSIRPNAYNTAWASRLRNMDGSLTFPEAKAWIIANQHADGSWGGVIEMAHDRTVSTLAAVVALKCIESESQVFASDDDRRAMRAIEVGSEYLRARASSWRHDPNETNAFELAVPFLAGEARSHSLSLPYESYSQLDASRKRKANTISRERLLSEPTSLLYGLESVPPGKDFRQLKKFVSSNGALANSPSATGAYWAATKDPLALRFLREVAHLHPNGGFPDVHPMDVFEWAWSLHFLSRSGLLDRQDRWAFKRLQTMLDDEGLAAYDSHVPVADSDDSAMTLSLLIEQGLESDKSLDKLLRFETDDCFTTFPHERRASISANARVLQALHRRPEIYDAQLRKLTDFLLCSRQGGAFWRDKWHASIYYATDAVVHSLAPICPEELSETWTWLIDTQHANGSWGVGGGNPEESAYAVLALAEISAHAQPPERLWKLASDYLANNVDNAEFPELWIGKGLYTPHHVVQAAVLAGWSVASRKANRTPLPCHSDPIG